MPGGINLYMADLVPRFAQDDACRRIAATDRLGAAADSWRAAPEWCRAMWNRRSAELMHAVSQAEAAVPLGDTAQRRKLRLQLRREHVDRWLAEDAQSARPALFLSPVTVEHWIKRGETRARQREHLREQNPGMNSRDAELLAREWQREQGGLQVALVTRNASEDDPQMRAAIAASLRAGERTPPHAPVVLPDPAPVHGGLAELGALSTTEEVVNAITCIICFEKPRNVVYSNCGHLCVCQDCASKSERKCPVCRTASGVQLVRLC